MVFKICQAARICTSLHPMVLFEIGIGFLFSYRQKEFAFKARSVLRRQIFLLFNVNIDNSEILYW